MRTQEIIYVNIKENKKRCNKIRKLGKSSKGEYEVTEKGKKRMRGKY